MLGLKPPELILIIAVILLLFGGKKIPELGAGIGQAIRGFKKAMNGPDEQEPPRAPEPPRAEVKALAPPPVVLQAEVKVLPPAARSARNG